MALQAAEVNTRAAEIAKTASKKATVWQNVVVRLADEGVPIRAIVRSLMLPYEEVREILNEASARGMIVAIPRDEWPPGTRRDERQPDTVPLEFEDAHMTMLAMRTFTLTPAEAKIFVVLLRRPEVTKGTLHSAIERDNNTEEPSQIKIVDVFICKLRKKLPEAIVIKTIWGRGYFITPEGKAEAFKLLGMKNEEFGAPKLALVN